jgi:hypothetical protein
LSNEIDKVTGLNKKLEKDNHIHKQNITEMFPPQQAADILLFFS